MKNIYFLLLFITSFCFSQNSNLLDTSFGTNGVTNFAFYNGTDLLNGVQFKQADKLADGKILVFGISQEGCHGSIVAQGGIVVRFTQNGILDTTFNNGAGYKIFPNKYFLSFVKVDEYNYLVRSNNAIIDKLVLDENDINLASNFTTYQPYNTLRDLSIGTDNKIYVLRNLNDGPNASITIVRLQADGTVDTTFGTNGGVNLGNTIKYGNIILKENSIYLSGILSNASYAHIVVSKLHLDGTFDSNFGVNGTFQTTTNYYLYSDPKIFIHDDGIISGFFAKGNTPSGLFQFQLLANGTLNTSYNNNGIGLISETGVYEENSNLTINKLDDDSLIVVGTINQPESFNAVKFTSNGNLDTTFGTNGIIVSNEMSPNYPYTGSYPHYHGNALIYGESIVFVGMFWEWNCASTKYVSQLTKYVFNEAVLNNENFEHSNKVFIYPNPVQDVLFLSEICNIEIFDLTGKILLKSENVSEINISNLSTGVYFAKISSNKNEVSSFKFIKK